MRRLHVLVLALCLARAARADEPPPPSVPEAADEVVAAFEAKQPERILALARRDRPEPWQVAELLCVRGAFDAAAAYAKAAPRVDVERLPAYVELRRKTPVPPVLVEACDRATEAVGRSDLDGVAAALEGVDLTLDSVTAALALFMRAHVDRRPGAWAQAAESYGRAAQMARRIGWLAGASDALVNEAAMHDRAGRISKAVAAFEAKLVIEQQRRLPTRIATTQANLGAMLEKQGAHGEAIERIEDALPGLGTGGNARFLGTALMNLAEARRVVGDLDGASEALARARAALEPLHVADLDVNLLLIECKQRESRGDSRGALALAEKAAELAKAGGVTTPMLAEVARRAADIRSGLGHLAEALIGYEWANDRLLEAGLPFEIASSAPAFASLLTRFGEGDRAVALLEESLAAVPEAALALRVDLLVSLAKIHAHAEEVARAEERLKQASDLAVGLPVGESHSRVSLALAEADLVGERDPGRAIAVLRAVLPEAVAHRDRLQEVQLRARLAGAEADAGHPGPALEQARSAQELARSASDPASAYGVLADFVLAKALAASGDDRAALIASRTAMDRLSRLWLFMDTSHVAYERSRFWALADLGASLSLRLKDVESYAWFLEQDRGALLLADLENGGRIRASLVSDSMRDELAKARSAEAKASIAHQRALRSKDAKATTVAATAVEQARLGVRKVAERARLEGRAGYVAAEPDGLAAVRARLRDDEAIVLYHVAAKVASALVVTKGGARVVELGPSEAILSACRGLRLAEGNPEGETALEALAARLVKPLALSASIRRISVSPDGPLFAVPLSLLFGDADVVNVPSTSVHGRLQAAKTPRGTGVLAFGNPEVSTLVGGKATRWLWRGAELVDLPEAAVEAKAVGTEVLVGAEATESALVARLTAGGPRRRALHLACHGMWDESPMFSCLALAPDAGNDGFVTALDVLGWRIDADLVCLSACDSGRQRSLRGGGALGLVRSFLSSGAPRVLASLWRVDDAAARELITAFYERWNQGMSPPRALREAQAVVRAKKAEWKNPQAWAGWVLWGVAD